MVLIPVVSKASLLHWMYDRLFAYCHEAMFLGKTYGGWSWNW